MPGSRCTNQIQDGTGFERGMLPFAVDLEKAWYFSHGSRSDLTSRLGILRFDDLSRDLRPMVPEELNC